MVNWFPGTYLHRLIWVEWKETFYWEMFSRSRAGTRTGEEKGRNYRKVAWWCYLGSVTWSRSVLHGETGCKRPQGHSVLLKTQVTSGWRTLWLCMELSKLWLRSFSGLALLGLAFRQSTRTALWRSQMTSMLPNPLLKCLFSSYSNFNIANILHYFPRACI